MFGKQRLKWADCVGFQCLSPKDTRQLYQNCMLGAPPGDLNYCVVFKGPEVICSDGSVRDPVTLTNWSCLDEGDANEFKIFCKRREGNAEITKRAEP